MSTTRVGARPTGEAGSPPAGPIRTGGHGLRRRRWLIALGAFGALCVFVAGVLAGTYQPLGFGGQWGGSFPGMPAGSGVRAVNTFGASTGDIYVPPQSGVFTVLESIQNSGPAPVTIDAITALRPDQTGITTPWPLTPAGQTLYMPADGPRPARGRPVAGLSLRPGHTILVGMPVRMSGACHVPNGWTGLSVFYVKERFLIFTHWVAIPLGTPLIFHEPEPGGTGMVCPAR
jgi:hypothetical protein